MTASVDDIAEAIRAAGADRQRSSDLLATLYADTVELQHSPPRPGDGSWPASTLVAVAKEELDAIQRAIPDAVVHVPLVVVDRDAVRVCNRIEGVLVDGTRIDLTTNTVFTVSDGRVVGLRSEMTSDDAQACGGVVAAGAFEVPADLTQP